MNYRELVPARADFHLVNWAEFRRRDGHIGYPSRSSGFSSGGISGDDSFEHMCEDADIRSALIADAVIDGLPVIYRVAISHVYEASVWQFKRCSLEDVFVMAVDEFWKMALRRGIGY